MFIIQTVFLLLMVRIEGQTEQKVLNSKVLISIELKELLVRTKNEVTFRNQGTEVIETYTYIVPSHHLHKLKCYNKKQKELKITKIYQNEQDFPTYEVFFDSILFPNQQYTFKCLAVFMGEIQNVFRKRKIDENQILRYVTNIGYFSKYHTSFAVCKIMMKSSLIMENFVPPTKTLSDLIIYETYDTKPYSKMLTTLIYINNNPLLIVKNLERQIRISPFNKIFIKDCVTLKNVGPKLHGPYYNSLNPPTKAASGMLYTHLPSSAQNIKYFDKIGNNSKSHVYNFIDFNTFAFKPRYPLLGGWKTEYILEYEVPTNEYLFRAAKFTMLQIRPVDHVINDAIIEKVMVQIFLPDGAKLDTCKLTNNSLSLVSKERECSADLCILGRHAIVLNGSNLFDDYIENVEIKYYLPELFLFKAPLLIAFYIEAVFLFAIFLRKWK